MRVAVLLLAVIAAARAQSEFHTHGEAEIVSATGGAIVDYGEPDIVDTLAKDVEEQAVEEPSPDAVAAAHEQLDQLEAAATAATPEIALEPTVDAEAVAAATASAEAETDVEAMLRHNAEVLTQLKAHQEQTHASIKQIQEQLVGLKTDLVKSQKEQMNLLHASHILTLKSNMVKLQGKRQSLQVQLQGHHDAVAHIDAQVTQLTEAKQNHLTEVDRIQEHISSLDAAIERSNAMLQQLGSTPFAEHADVIPAAAADHLAATEQTGEEDAAAMLRGMRERLDSLRSKLSAAMQAEPEAVVEEQAVAVEAVAEVEPAPLEAVAEVEPAPLEAVAEVEPAPLEAMQAPLTNLEQSVDAMADLD